MLLKKPILLSILALFALSASAQNLLITKGSFEIALSGNVDTDAPGGTQAEINARVGGFIRNYVQVGLDLEWDSTDAASRTAVGVYGVRLYETRTYLLPYVGGSLGFGSADVETAESETGLELALLGGIKYFVSDNVSINTEFNVSISSGETFLGEDGTESLDVGLQFGLSYLW